MRTMALSSSVTCRAILRLAHEALTCCADERNSLREEDAHRVPQGNRLLVDAARRLDLRERRRCELDCRVERQGRELLALRFLHAFGLLLRKLAQAAHQILGVTPERESEATTATFHPPRLAVPCSAPRPQLRPRPPRAQPAASPPRTASRPRRRAPARAAGPPRRAG